MFGNLRIGTRLAALTATPLVLLTILAVFGIFSAHKLADQTTDLLISEQADAQGDLRPWLQEQWEAHRCRHVLLSTAARDTPRGEPWLMDVLYKPYAPEALLKALES